MKYTKLMGKKVVVYWGDAFELIGKNYKTPYKKSLTATVGYIADEDEKRIYLSMFFCGIAKKLTSPYVAIPKGTIDKVVKLNMKGDK
jgi:hypothetical protein